MSDTRLPSGNCVCAEINTRHCPVHGQGSRPPIWLGEPYTFGNCVLWPLTVVCWSLPVLWRLGNRISDLRFWLYMRYRWEWV